MTFRVVASVPASRPELRRPDPGDAAPPAPSRRVHAGGESHDARIHTRLAPGDRLDGLAIVELADTTVVVGIGQAAVVDDHGNLVISLGKEAA